jgi:hypothetical protein
LKRGEEKIEKRRKIGRKAQKITDIKEKCGLLITFFKMGKTGGFRGENRIKTAQKETVNF